MSGIDLIYGPMLIGVFFNCILLGVMIMQAFIYHQTYTTDSRWIRYFVLYLVTLEFLNTACDMYLIYQPLIQEYATPAAVTYFPMMLAASPIVTVCVSTPVQMFTAWRISIVSQSKKIAAMIWLFSVISFVGGTWVGIHVVTFKVFAKKNTFAFNLPGVIWFVASACADVLITSTLAFSLARRRTGHATTNVLVNRIIRLTIQTGLVTMIFAMADLLFFTISPKTAISFVWDFSISKLYTNALLSTLNARAGWNNLNGNDQDPDNVLFGDTTFRVASQPSRGILGSSGPYNGARLGNGNPSGTEVESHEMEHTKYKPDVNINVTQHVVADYCSTPQNDPTDAVTQ